MSLSMYQASVPAFIRMLNNLSAIIDKAAAHAEAKKIDPSVLLQARLYPDMFHFAKQVQIAADFTKGPTARLAGLEPPKYDDIEISFADLKARIQKTIAYVQTFKPEQIDGSEAKMINIKAGSRELSFPGQAYLLHFALPNLYFHAATAYDILRHNGVELGKMDFIGAPN